MMIQIQTVKDLNAFIAVAGITNTDKIISNLEKHKVIVSHGIAKLINSKPSMY